MARLSRQRLEGSIVAAVAAAVVLSGCLGMSGGTGSSTTSMPIKVATRVPHGFAAIDVGFVRLIAPSTWSLQVAAPNCSAVRGHRARCSAPCAPGAPQTVVVTSVAPRLACKTDANGYRDEVWIFTNREKAGTRNLHVDDGSIIRSVPSLGVVLYGFGPLGAHIARTAGPSSLAALVAAHTPIDVPPGRRTVSAGPLVVSVPRRWPRRHLTARSWPVPGLCASRIFLHPIVYTGWSNELSGCTLIDAQSILYATVLPGDGVWIVVSHRRVNLHAFFPPTGRIVSVRGLRVMLRLGLPEVGVGGDSVQLLASVGHTTISITLGLGLNPLVAEEILSSIRPARGAG